MPTWVLERMGLLEQPPHCQVSVAASEGEQLLQVSVDDVRRFHLPWSSSGGGSLLGDSAGAPAGGEASAAAAAHAAELQQQEEGPTDYDVTASLQMENARLRAELASQIALDCIRTAQLAATITLPRQAGTAGPGAPAAPGPGPEASQHATADAPGEAPLPPDAGQKFERALAAKDGFIGELQGHLRSVRGQAASYESRIRQLESLLVASPRARGTGGTASTSTVGAPAPGEASALLQSARAGSTPPLSPREPARAAGAEALSAAGSSHASAGASSLAGELRTTPPAALSVGAIASSRAQQPAHATEGALPSSHGAAASTSVVGSHGPGGSLGGAGLDAAAAAGGERQTLPAAAAAPEAVPSADSPGQAAAAQRGAGQQGEGRQIGERGELEAEELHQGREQEEEHQLQHQQRPATAVAPQVLEEKDSSDVEGIEPASDSDGEDEQAPREQAQGGAAAAGQPLPQGEEQQQQHGEEEGKQQPHGEEEEEEGEQQRQEEEEAQQPQQQGEAPTASQAKVGDAQ